MTELGRRVKELRKQLGLSQKELGEMFGVPQSVISDIENGVKTYVNKKHKIKVSKVLGISIEELIRLEAR